MKSTRLQFENFARPFVTHGIDITPDPNDKDGAVYIFAVNHMPNPDFYDDDAPSSYAEDNDVPRARSQIELFHHVLGSKTVKHVRSIQHPMIKTPNDIYAASPASFYVTNDHFYRGGLQRSIEDVLPAAKWSNIVHVQVDDLVVADEGEEASSSGIRVSEALTGLHNNNGFGHGEHSDEMLIVSAMSGILYRAKSSNHSISVLDSIPLDSMGDNPSYFRDLYATPAEDKSGYLVAGLARPVDLVKNFADPTARDGVVVWYVRRGAAGGWEKRLIFEDDGSTIRTASAAVLVGIEPRANEKKKAWLFVTGFISESVVAVQVEL